MLPSMVSDLVTAVRQRTNTENSNFVTDDEIVTLLNKAYVELYDYLIQTFESYVVTSTDITLIQNQDTYALPSDFYKCLGVDMWLDAVRKITLSKFNFSDRNRFQTTTWLPVLSANPLRYRIVGNNLKIIPSPASAYKMTLWYAPQPLELALTVTDPTNQTNQLQSILGIFDDYIIMSAAIDVLQKEESDTTNLVRDREQYIERIRMSLGTRDDQNDTVTDIYTMNGTIVTGGWFR